MSLCLLGSITQVPGGQLTPASALAPPSCLAQTLEKYSVLLATPCPGGCSPLPGGGWGGPSVQLRSSESGDPLGSLPAARELLMSDAPGR